jgi:opacity protein-like surface antigen
MRFSPRYAIVLMLLALAAAASPAFADTPRATLYFMGMEPADANARDFGGSGVGGGLDVSWPLHGTEGLLSVIGGFEGASFLSRVKKIQDPFTGLRVEQHTDQSYGRIFIGGELGPHGNGFLEPYANAAVAAVFYGISTTVVIPNDLNPENTITQNKGSHDEAAFGWSAGTGLILNFGHWGLDGGVRYLQQYGLPQQLGAGAVTIQPSYLQYRLGVSLMFQR